MKQRGKERGDREGEEADSSSEVTVSFLSFPFLPAAFLPAAFLPAAFLSAAFFPRLFPPPPLLQLLPLLKSLLSCRIGNCKA
ncbi:MAG TPA: hypothetical protein K8V78_02775 [Lacrimispora saccharolytica]|nr:hypothetical protein [Lacrimispora saccharolytica]